MITAHPFGPIPLTWKPFLMLVTVFIAAFLTMIEVLTSVLPNPVLDIAL